MGKSIYRMHYDFHDYSHHPALLSMLKDGWYLKRITEEDGYSWVILQKSN